MSGTIALVTVEVGSAVSASSTTAAITVIGDSGYLVSSTVPLSVIDKVKVGAPAAVTVSSAGTPLTGSVPRIGVLTSDSTTTTSFPVTIRLDPTDLTLFNGSNGSVQITVGSVSGVLTVPSSAVHTDGSQRTVQVLADGVVAPTPVDVGAVGTDYTEITGGLTAGQQVVLADLNAAMPTSASTTTSSGNLLGGNGTGRAGQFDGTGGEPA